MEPRDELIERIAEVMYGVIVPPDPWWVGEEDDVRHLWRVRARHLLSVVETATSACDNPGCEKGRVSIVIDDDNGFQYEEFVDCMVCGGQPGLLLILQVLSAKEAT